MAEFVAEVSKPIRRLEPLERPAEEASMLLQYSIYIKSFDFSVYYYVEIYTSLPGNDIIYLFTKKCYIL